MSITKKEEFEIRRQRFNKELPKESKLDKKTENRLIKVYLQGLQKEFEIIKERTKNGDLTATKALVAVNRKIIWCISTLQHREIDVNDTILTKIANLKKTFIHAAKKEITKEISKIFKNSSLDEPTKINNYCEYMNNLEKMGINLSLLDEPDEVKIYRQYLNEQILRTPTDEEIEKIRKKTIQISRIITNVDSHIKN